MNYLANREHSRHELRSKLVKHDYDLQDIEQALDQLQQDSLQCDQRFADSYVRSKVAAGFGPRYLEQQLQSRRVDAELIADALSTVEAWQPVIARVWLKKYRDSESTLQQQAKQRRFLLSRGFDNEQISDWMRSGIKQFETEE